MGALTDIGNLLIQTFFYLFLLAILLRLLLQITRADFYNPISQFLVKVTDPLLRPLRRVIPGIMGIDLASVILAVVVQMIAISLLLVVNTGGLAHPLFILIWAALGCVGMIVNIYFFTILISIILSWVAPGSYNPAVLLIHQLTEPVLAPFRNLLPAMGGLDISPIFVFLVINVIKILLNHMAAAVGLHPMLVIGL